MRRSVIAAGLFYNTAVLADFDSVHMRARGGSDDHSHCPPFHPFCFLLHGMDGSDGNNTPKPSPTAPAVAPSPQGPHTSSSELLPGSSVQTGSTTSGFISSPLTRATALTTTLVDPSAAVFISSTTTSSPTQQNTSSRSDGDDGDDGNDSDNGDHSDDDDHSDNGDHSGNGDNGDGKHHWSHEDNPHDNNDQTARIVGAVLGSFAAVLLVVFFVLWFKYRSKHRRLLEEHNALKERDLESYRSWESRSGEQKGSLNDDSIGSGNNIRGDAPRGRPPEAPAASGVQLSQVEGNMRPNVTSSISSPPAAAMCPQTRPLSPMVIPGHCNHEHAGSDPSNSQTSLISLPPSIPPRAAISGQSLSRGSLPYFPTPFQASALNASRHQHVYYVQQHSMSQPNFHHLPSDQELERQPPPPRYPDAVAALSSSPIPSPPSPHNLPSPTSSIGGPPSPVLATSPLSNSSGSAPYLSLPPPPPATSPPVPLQHRPLPLLPPISATHLADTKADASNTHPHSPSPDAKEGVPQILAPICQLGQTSASPPEYDESAELVAGEAPGTPHLVHPPNPAVLHDEADNDITATPERTKSAAARGAVYRY